MGWNEFVSAIKGTEEFDAEFAKAQPNPVYIITVAVLKVINRVSFTIMVFRFLQHLETYGISFPF